MTPDSFDRRFLLHRFLSKFAQSIGFVFGALLLYEKTHSVLAVLLLGLAEHTVSLLIKSAGLQIIIRIIRKVGARKVAAASLGIAGANACILYLLPFHTPQFYIIILAFACIHSIASSTYHVISNTLQYQSIGRAPAPRGKSAQFVIVQLGAGLSAGALGLLLNSKDSLLLLFAFSATATFLSMATFPRDAAFGPLPDIRFRHTFRKVSPQGILANINPDHRLLHVGLPLFLALTFSAERSASVAGASAMITIVLAAAIGSANDRANRFALVLLACALIAGWASLAAAESLRSFTIASAAIGVASSLLTVNRESLLGTEVAGRSAPLEATLAIEFARHCGIWISHCLMLAIFLWRGTIPQQLFALGALFVIPKIAYCLWPPGSASGRGQASDRHCTEDP